MYTYSGSAPSQNLPHPFRLNKPPSQVRKSIKKVFKRLSSKMPLAADNTTSNTDCRECKLGIFCYDHIKEKKSPQQHKTIRTTRQEADPKVEIDSEGPSVLRHTQSPTGSHTAALAAQNPALNLPRILVNGKEVL
jgi:hypothetical protein